jgi:hypothetical protein
MQMQLQMPITMDVVIFYGTSARFTVPLSILVPLIKMHLTKIIMMRILSGLGIGIMDLLKMLSVLFSSPCPLLSLAVTSEHLSGGTAAHQEPLLQIGRAEIGARNMK